MASQVELLPPVGATSKAWDYFGFPAKDGMHVIFLKIIAITSEMQDICGASLRE